MDGHIKAVGILHAIWAAMGLATVLIVMLFFGGVAQFVMAQGHIVNTVDQHVLQMFITIFTIVLAVVFVCALPGLIAGIAVMSYQNWARWVLVVLSALHLFAFPVGTVLGGYSLWVLLNPDTAQLFEQGGLRRE